MKELCLHTDIEILPQFLACQLTDFGFTSPHNHMNQFLKINLFMYFQLALFLWRTLIHTL